MMRWSVEVRKGGWQYKVKGLLPDNQAINFTLHRLGENQWKLSGNDSAGVQRRYKLTADSLDSAISQAEPILGLVPPETSANLTLDDVLLRWLEARDTTTKTVADYRGYIDQFLAWVDQRGNIRLYADLRLEHLQAYANQLHRGGKAEDTIRLYTMPLTATARWASANWPGQFSDISTGFKLPKVARTTYQEEETPAFSLREACKFLEYLETAPEGEKVILSVALQALAGLRETEVLRLTRDKLYRDLLTVEGVVKNGKSLRRIPLPALVLDYIAEYPDGDRFTTYHHYTAYSQVVTEHMSKWVSLDKQDPGWIDSAHRIPARELRRTIPTEFQLRGLHGWSTERYLGHAPSTITDKHYVALPEAKKIEMMRIQVARPINRILRTFRAKKHDKSKVDNLIILGEARKCS